MITDLSHLPVVLLITDVAKIYRRSVGTIRRDCQRGTFYPSPKWTRPYRWPRIDIERDIERRTDDALAHLADPPAPVAATPTRRRKRAR